VGLKALGALEAHLENRWCATMAGGSSRRKGAVGMAALSANSSERNALTTLQPRGEGGQPCRPGPRRAGWSGRSGRVKKRHMEGYGEAGVCFVAKQARAGQADRERLCKQASPQGGGTRSSPVGLPQLLQWEECSAHSQLQLCQVLGQLQPPRLPQGTHLRPGVCVCGAGGCARGVRHHKDRFLGFLGFL
jgi:hypothetical protein